MTSFNVPDMTCGHCKAAVERAVTAADPAAKVQVDLSDRTVTVASDLSDAALIAAMQSEGYTATPRA